MSNWSRTAEVHYAERDSSRPVPVGVVAQYYTCFCVFLFRPKFYRWNSRTVQSLNQSVCLTPSLRLSAKSRHLRRRFGGSALRARHLGSGEWWGHEQRACWIQPPSPAEDFSDVLENELKRFGLDIDDVRG